MGNGWRGLGDDHRTDGHGGARCLVYDADEGGQAPKEQLQAASASRGAICADGHDELFEPDFCGRFNGCRPEYDDEIRCAGSDLWSGGIDADSDGGAGHCDEVLPDRHRLRGGLFRRMYSRCRL